MRVIVEGSSQKKHVRALFGKMGIECVDLSNDPNAIKCRMSNIFKLISCDAIYHVGGFDIETSYFYKLARLLGKRIVIHWIGTDVLNITHSYNSSPKEINSDCTNLAGSELLREELSRINIVASVVPIVPMDIHFTPLPAPKEHAVMVYIPKGRENFYGIDIVKEVARAFPGVPFHIVANDGENDLDRLDNVFYEGMLNAEEMTKLYEKCSILFRYPEHDGLSMMLLEAMGTGRTVIYKYELPHAITPKDGTTEEIIKSFAMVLSTPPRNNEEGIDYVATEFSVEKQVERYRKAGVL